MIRRWNSTVGWLTNLYLASVVVVAGCSGGGGDGAQTEVTIGYQKTGSLNLLRLRGGLEPALARLKARVKWVGFSAGPQLLEALNAGSIDFGHTGDAPPILAQAAGVPFVYVGCEPARPRAEAILVPADSALKSVAELKGKRIALNKGSNVHNLLVRALERAGVRYDEVRPVFLPPSDARAAFEGGSVDAWAAWDPYYAEAEAHANARVLSDGDGLVANREFLIATRAFARDHPEVIAAILDGLGGQADWTRSHLDEVARLFGNEIGLDIGTMRRVIDRKAFGLAPMDREVVAEQQRVADLFAELGLIPAKLSVREAVLAPTTTNSSQGAGG
ncbi:sulfonate transport system substrate-binding protein [Singulisphaera sp. GP187]|uniref:sulfonate ABC transporter substrate-binding protein n=1 Tax=Singulisphaera sp. GP187 TaxID=1882752 RepID=UPI000926041F|nr:sulfonate ABC transporter substrate-binding protein [Singulisphaera sp. GP187]SIO18328.1 sulfonate transport system substrate-binding protein [Singulisphaera sp. GP187]